MTSEMANLPALGQEPVGALVIPAQDDEPVRLEYVHGQQLRALQKLVHGTVASLSLGPTEATLHFNEEGRERGLDPNDRARLLAWAHSAPARERYSVAGDAVILGRRDGGRNVSVPVRWTQLLLYCSRFQVQICYRRQPETWFSTGPVCDSWHLAYRRAVALTQNTRTPPAVRVVDAGRH